MEELVVKIGAAYCAVGIVFIAVSLFVLLLFLVKILKDEM